ncbi:TPA: hypothetical protein ACGTKP_002801 [Salmonella enterica]
MAVHLWGAVGFFPLRADAELYSARPSSGLGECNILRNGLLDVINGTM